MELARELAFTLARLTVTPACRTIAAEGWSQRLEPRAMQVLVVLAQASPEVVGRAELNARVWRRRVVGEDAINRAVQTLRRLAAEAPPPAPFHIETIPRVGYRLMAAVSPEVVENVPISASPSQPSAGPAIPRSAPPWWRLRWGRRCAIVAVALGTLVLVSALAVLRLREPVGQKAAWRIAAAATLDDLPPNARDGTLSPDGRQLAYRGQDAVGRDRIFVRAVADGGIGRAVTPPDYRARHPAWSPDGTALAFVGYDADRPCWLFVLRFGQPIVPAGKCETAREPRLAWSADARSLLFGDAPGENAVHRIGAVDLADGHRGVLSSPPGDSLGDDLPVPFGNGIVFQRIFGWADEGWIARDSATGRERLLWRRRGLAGSVATPLPDGGLAVAWTRNGAVGFDVIDADGRIASQPVALGPVTAVSAARSRVLVETDHGETALVRPGHAETDVLMSVRGRMAGVMASATGGLRVPVAAAGLARILDRDPKGHLQSWGSFTASRIVGLSPSPDGRRTAALVTDDAGRSIVVFDAAGRPTFRWNPGARSLNPAAWTADGRHLVAPMLDGAGWRLYRLDPVAGGPARDLGLPGFAVLMSRGHALYAVRAGEATGMRELWRLDGEARRLPIDLTLFDIVNWRAVDGGIWLPDRRDRARPRLVLRDEASGRVVRSLAAPGLSGPGSGLAVDAAGPIYVRTMRDAPDYNLLTLVRSGGRNPASSAER